MTLRRVRRFQQGEPAKPQPDMHRVFDDCLRALARFEREEYMAKRLTGMVEGRRLVSLDPDVRDQAMLEVLNRDARARGKPEMTLEEFRAALAEES